MMTANDRVQSAPPTASDQNPDSGTRGCRMLSGVDDEPRVGMADDQRPARVEIVPAHDVQCKAVMNGRAGDLQGEPRSKP